MLLGVLALTTQLAGAVSAQPGVVAMCLVYTTADTAELIPAPALSAAMTVRADALRLVACADEDEGALHEPPSFRLALQRVSGRGVLVTVEGAGLFESREVDLEGTRLPEERAQRVALVVADQIRPALAALLARLATHAPVAAVPAPNEPGPASLSTSPGNAREQQAGELAAPASPWGVDVSGGVTLHPALRRLEPRVQAAVRRRCGGVQCGARLCAERLPDVDTERVALDGYRLALGLGAGGDLGPAHLSAAALLAGVRASARSDAALAFDERWIFALGAGLELAVALVRGSGWSLGFYAGTTYWPKPQVFTVGGEPALELGWVEVFAGLGAHLGE